MQGLHDYIPAETKGQYLNLLLQCGFDTLDFGSFVSAKAIPQLADTPQVIGMLQPAPTQLLAIVANPRGAAQAMEFEEVKVLGYPLSVSETFQQKNTNRSIAEALADVQSIQNDCLVNGKKLRVYLSMGFGNPYGDDYSPQMVTDFAGKLVAMGITEIALADTVGSSEPGLIDSLFSTLIPALPQAEFVAHFHSTPYAAGEKIEAALQAGCRSFDSAILGFGGCPMAKDDLTGNIATETLLAVARRLGYTTSINQPQFDRAVQAAQSVFFKTA